MAGSDSILDEVSRRGSPAVSDLLSHKRAMSRFDVVAVAEAGARRAEPLEATRQPLVDLFFH